MDEKSNELDPATQLSLRLLGCVLPAAHQSDAPAEVKPPKARKRRKAVK